MPINAARETSEGCGKRMGEERFPLSLLLKFSGAGDPTRLHTRAAANRTPPAQP
ncbi:hypothetical protein M422DRAFT_27026 [Sphaerobolus stellatus SS14]|uniref:Uncharacterized protein n=1 Tax=Sphaerobolus stellatus (strain SS14) TaxID=990650 RepID=A0A0C9TLZ5_SPHS4|nr:hypothetical protein M422DRAFT_39898 [Sphaerobolus stellatus SS14]KIJ50881.1 hypothetical protein M422DRAFT_27026 [Sphaerobolus stellatus SS14]